MRNLDAIFNRSCWHCSLSKFELRGTTSKQYLMYLMLFQIKRDPWEFYVMFLSQEIDIKLCQIDTKIYIYKMLHKNSRFKRIILSKYTTNLKTKISQRSLRNLSLLLLLLEFNQFSFLIDTINNIINMSVSRDQNSHQYVISNNKHISS